MKYTVYLWTNLSPWFNTPVYMGGMLERGLTLVPWFNTPVYMSWYSRKRTNFSPWFNPPVYMGGMLERGLTLVHGLIPRFT